MGPAGRVHFKAFGSLQLLRLAVHLSPELPCFMKRLNMDRDLNEASARLNLFRTQHVLRCFKPSVHRSTGIKLVLFHPNRLKLPAATSNFKTFSRGETLANSHIQNWLIRGFAGGEGRGDEKGGAERIVVAYCTGSACGDIIVMAEIDSSCHLSGINKY